MTYVPATSAAMKTSLASNILTVCPIWTITSQDGLVAAYAAHTRPTVGRLINGAPPFLFNGVTYKVRTVQTTRDMHKIGLSPNSTELFGLFDEKITLEDVNGGRWKMARIAYEYVNYLDLTQGSTSKIAGVAGKWMPLGNLAYQVELMSKATLLDQHIGDLTSDTDRSPFPKGVSKAAFTVTRNVVSSADRRHLVIDGAAKPDHYYQYGVLKVTTGINSKYPGMEIKDNVGNIIELVLSMAGDFTAGNVVTLLAGYDGTREQARDKFGAMLDFRGEADIPGMKTVYSYPG